MRSLDEIAISNGADKGSTHPVHGHDYARHYQQLFEPLRLHKIRLLEVGVGGGESVRTWLDYFSIAHVYGVDIVEKTNPWNTPGSGVHPRYDFLQGNQSDPTMWACLAVNWGYPFDIIIDDSSHMSCDVVRGFSNAWPLLASGGFYALEDTGVTYTTGTIFHTPGFPTHFEWIHDKVSAANIGTKATEIDGVFVFSGLVILSKK